jgi:FtsP/CotA-like multicopper oxidase with cupredoxin domain
MTQDPIAPGASFSYAFTAPDPGTFFFHPHVGVQLDRGLYAPLVIDDPAEPGGYDDEWVVVLDDWLDGTGRTPDEVLQRLRDAGGSTGMGRMPGMGGMGGTGGRDGTGVGFLSDAGDVSYPYFLVNGRVPSAPTVFTSRPGRRLRMRIVNAASDTVFALARSADNNRRGQVLASVRYRFDW